MTGSGDAGLKDRIVEEVRTSRDSLASLCADLVQIPSPTPPGDTTRIADHLSTYLLDSGLLVDRYEPAPGMVSLRAVVGNRAVAPSLVVNGHLDTFPQATGAWRHGSAYSGAIEDGAVYGAGACDMRAGLAADAFLARLLSRELRDAPGRVDFLFVADEEAGGRWGTSWLLDRLPEISAGSCLVGDQLGAGQIGVAERGLAVLDIETQGLRGHAAYGNEESALHVLLDLLGRLRTLDTSSPGGEVTSARTVNVGTVAGGTSPGLVADSAHAGVDIRVPPGDSLEALVDSIRRTCAEVDERVRLSVRFSAEPTVTPHDSSIVRSATAATRLVRGEAAPCVVRTGASDARLFRQRGVPTVVYGARPASMGGVDEHVEVDELVDVAAVHACIIVDHLTGSVVR